MIKINPHSLDYEDLFLSSYVIGYPYLMVFRQTILKFYRNTVRKFSGHHLGRRWPFNVLNVAILNSLKGKYANIGGHKMILDTGDSLALSLNGIYERQETGFVEKEIKPGQTVVDIGAHIGYYSLIFAKLVGPSGIVYAFEPDPTNFSILQKNIKLNGYNNIVPINKAVTEKSGALNLYVSDGSAGDHKIYNSDENRKTLQIDGVALDDFFKDKKVDFIKMDIQGAEGGALKGMASLLENSKDIKVISEFTPSGIKKYGMEPRAYLELWQKLGFKLYNLNRKTRQIEDVDSLDNLLATYTVEGNKYTNLIAVK